MARTSKAEPSTLRELELELIWGAWCELGVSGWGRTHEAWAVDPEPLLMRTAELADVDPRLRDEVLDWCISNWRYVSRVRLRSLLRARSEQTLAGWGRFAATVNRHSTANWPGATDEIPYRPRGRSSMTSMEQPSRAWLRMRATFGVGARTEILRYLISGSSLGSAAVIAEYVGYARRNVSTECDSLEMAGVLTKRRVANRNYYSLQRPDALRAFVGDIAPITPSWTALIGVTSALVRLEEQAAHLPAEVLMVEAHRTVQQLEDPLDQLEVEARPDLSRTGNYWSETRDFAYTYLSAWASGQWNPQSRGPLRKERS